MIKKYILIDFLGEKVGEKIKSPVFINYSTRFFPFFIIIKRLLDLIVKKWQIWQKFIVGLEKVEDQTSSPSSSLYMDDDDDDDDDDDEKDGDK